MARRKRLSNRIGLASLVVFLISLVAMYSVTCMKVFSDEYLVNNAGPISDSYSYFAAAAVCGLSFISGILLALMWLPIRVAHHKIKPFPLFILSAVSLLFVFIGILVGWFLYGDSVFCRGCETGSCGGLIFFRAFKFWSVGFMFVASCVLMKDSLVESFK